MTDWLDKLKERLERGSQVETVTVDGGERDYIAGQRDMEYVDLDVKLEMEIADKVTAELAQVTPEGEPKESDTLRAVRQWLELDMHLAPGEDWTMNDDLDYGVVQVRAQHDHRPGEFGGSDVTRRFPKPSRRGL